jgi:predicted aldo/keto reductase-like oxidoreductase
VWLAWAAVGTVVWGLGRGRTEAEAIALVRQALDRGLNLLDTAAAYGTEALIGKAIKTVPRDRVVITTKALINRGSVPLPPERVVASLENSLRQLDTDYRTVNNSPHSLATYLVWGWSSRTRLAPKPSWLHYGAGYGNPGLPRRT